MVAIALTNGRSDSIYDPRLHRFELSIRKLHEGRYRFFWYQMEACSLNELARLYPQESDTVDAKMREL